MANTIGIDPSHGGAGSVKPFVILPGEGEEIRGPVGGPTTFKARAETTNGTFTALENVIPPRQGPPLHLHVREDEMWYVLDGHVRFKAADRIFDGPTRSFMFIPQVWNASSRVLPGCRLAPSIPPLMRRSRTAPG